MKRSAIPDLSRNGEQSLTQYEQHLRVEVDLSPASIRNYLSDVRQFMAWCEYDWSAGQEDQMVFAPEHVATPTITAYRAYLQDKRKLKPASVNRYLVSLKRYFNWAGESGLIQRDPARPVKLVGEEKRAPHHITDREEAALMAMVEAMGNRRDRTIIILMLHTGLRAGEVCSLKHENLVIHKRSGYVRVTGKGNKYREVPLNITVRKALHEYLAAEKSDSEWLFNSTRTGEKLTTRALGYIIRKYAGFAQLPNVRPHDLRHRFGYRMAQTVPLHRLAQIMGHDSLDTTMLYIQGTAQDLQQAVENIAWE